MFLNINNHSQPCNWS